MPSGRGYNVLAPIYDVLADIVFGGSLYQAQIEFLGEIPHGSKVLVLGGGTGRWLRESSVQKCDAHITYIDVSRSMIKRATRNGRGLNIRFVEGTYDTLTGNGNFDVLIAFCFFDLFDDQSLPRVVSGMGASMKSGAQWLVVDFVNHKWWHATLLFVMHSFFRITTGLKTWKLPHWEKALELQGLREEKYRKFYGEFIRSSKFVSGR